MGYSNHVKYARQFPRALLLIGILVFFSSGCQKQVGKKPPVPTEKVTQTYTIGNRFEQDTDAYHVILEPEEPPLTVGKEERFELQIQDKATHHPMTFEDVHARIYMVMHHDMGAPTSIHQLSGSNTYEIETKFLMPGQWRVEITQGSSTPIASFMLRVEN
jgi:hypothetical protein